MAARRHAAALVLIALAALPMAGAPAAALLAAAPPPGAGAGLLLALVPPWRDADAVLAAAGARPVGLADAPLARFAAEARPHDPRPLSARLVASGALLALDAAALARFCRARP